MIDSQVSYDVGMSQDVSNWERAALSKATAAVAAILVLAISLRQLLVIARRFRAELVNRVVADVERAAAEGSEDNPSTQDNHQPRR